MLNHFLKTPCYLIVISKCLIKNDNFKGETCCALVNKNVKPCPQG